MEEKRISNVAVVISFFKYDFEDVLTSVQMIYYQEKSALHALWYIRVWSIRVSTRFLKKIRVYKCPFSDNFKGIFLSEYSDYEMIKGGYKGTTSTHSKVLIRLSCP